MKTVSKEVKMKGKTVDTVQVPVLETIDELSALDEKILIDLVNRQRCTDMCNAARSAHREAQPGKTKRYECGVNVLFQITFSDGTTGLQKLQEIQGLDFDKRKAAMDQLIQHPEIQAEVTKRLGPAA